LQPYYKLVEKLIIQAMISILFKKHVEQFSLISIGCSNTP